MPQIFLSVFNNFIDFYNKCFGKVLSNINVSRNNKLLLFMFKKLYIHVYRSKQLL